MDTGPTGEHNEGERESHRDTEAELDGLNEGSVGERREDVTTEVRIAESDITKEANSDVDCCT